MKKIQNIFSRTIIFFLVSLILLALFSSETAFNRNNKPQTTNQISGLWQHASENNFIATGNRLITPQKYLVYRLNQSALNGLLARVPMEFTQAAREQQTILELPYPDGKIARFRIEESPIMERALAAKFPEIKTYSGQGIDDPTATIRFDVTPKGFHAQVISAQETIYIDPYADGDTEYYISYLKRDFRKSSSFGCLVGANPEFPVGAKISEAQMMIPVPSNGATLRNYRLALGATGEYTVAAGGTVPLAMARMTTSLNRVNGIYERELALRMTLVANNNLLIYTDPNTDPYTNSDGFTMMGQHQTNVDTLIGPANYDMGHIFSTGGGGVARVRSTCNATFKAQGVTGLPNPVGDPFDVDYVAHEMGHQHGGLHTFNTIDGVCTGNRNMISAFEPASGSTPMSYVGTCAPANLQPNSNDYFHVRSLDEMVAHMTVAGNCAPQTSTGNTPPTVNAGANFNIPRNTPFALTASGSDVNGDAVTYTWEEYDLGPASPPEGDGDGSARPIFRSYSPTTNPTRTFPSLQYILNNANVPPTTYNCGLPSLCLTGESLPNITRVMNFQVTARDNRAGGGGIVSAGMQVSVNAGAGPFVVTQPNTGVSWQGGTQQTILWDVANTTAAPISAANVNILLSTDGGNTFPIVIVASTPNDGTQTITVPNNPTTQARVKVEAVGNIFFDINNVNFTITGGVPTPKKPFDFEGDGKTDISIFRPSVGQWWIQRSSDSVTNAFTFGTSTDKIVPADYDGDSKTDIAFWRPSTGEWFVLRSSNLTFFAAPFGVSTDIPAPGDFDGDGKADLTVFRPSAGTWFINKSTGGVQTTPFGVSGDIPTVGDYDGDSKSDIAIFRPAGGSGSGEWWISRSTAGLFAASFGTASDKPVVGDYTGDGKADCAFWRPSTANWFVLRSEDLSFFAAPFGVSTDTPVPGDYDGDGKNDLAVFRPSSVTWFVLKSTGGTLIQTFGAAGDVPVPSAFVP